MPQSVRASGPREKNGYRGDAAQSAVLAGSNKRGMKAQRPFSARQQQTREIKVQKPLGIFLGGRSILLFFVLGILFSSLLFVVGCCCDAHLR